MSQLHLRSCKADTSHDCELSHSALHAAVTCYFEPCYYDGGGWYFEAVGFAAPLPLVVPTAVQLFGHTYTRREGAMCSQFSYRWSWGQFYNVKMSNFYPIILCVACCWCTPSLKASLIAITSSLTLPSCGRLHCWPSPSLSYVTKHIWTSLIERISLSSS